jgi:hypothetical protein
VGANPQQSLIAREIVGFVRGIIASPEAFSKVIFDPNNRKLITDLAKGKTKGDRAIDALNLLKRGTLQVGTRGVAASETTPTVVEEQMLPEVTVTGDREPTLEELLKEAESRGMTVAE